MTGPDAAAHEHQRGRGRADGEAAHGAPPVGPARDRLLSVVRERGYTRRAEPFRLSSGGTSRDYVDLRHAVARGQDLRLAAEAVVAAVADLGVAFDAIGGMTMGADPVAHAVALLTGTAWYSVRKAEKHHGTGRRIEGYELGPGSRALVFEDTVSTSRSLVEALDVVETSGATVVLACTIFDRGDTAAQLLRERSIPYLPILTYHDLGIEPIVPLAASEMQASGAEAGGDPEEATP